MKPLLVIPVLLAALVGCGASSEPESAPKPVTTTITETPPSLVFEDSPATEAEPTESVPTFPKGYPKIVAVKTLPNQVRSWYEMSDLKKAVAIAPGVWTELPPGAEMVDAIASGSLDGFCGSIKAYERKYTAGEEHGGTCW